MKSIIDNVIIDIKNLEDDRLDRQGCSQTKLNLNANAWLKESYENTLKTAISLRMLIDKL